MKAICKYNSTAVLSESYFNKGCTPQTKFHVRSGEEYMVLAMGLWGGNIFILLIDDTNYPIWYPLDLFFIDKTRFPEGWIFRMGVDSEEVFRAVWGYEEFISDPGFNDAIMERDPNALLKFYEIKEKLS